NVRAVSRDPGGTPVGGRPPVATRRAGPGARSHRAHDLCACRHRGEEGHEAAEAPPSGVHPQITEGRAAAARPEAGAEFHWSRISAVAEGLAFGTGPSLPPPGGGGRATRGGSPLFRWVCGAAARARALRAPAARGRPGAPPVSCTRQLPLGECSW